MDVRRERGCGDQQIDDSPALGDFVKLTALRAFAEVLVGAVLAGGVALTVAAPTMAETASPSAQASSPVSPASTSMKPSSVATEGEHIVGTYTPRTTTPEGVQVVKVGIYPIDVYDIDYKANSYAMTAYVWMQWNGDIDPTSTLEFTNAIEDWAQLRTNLYEEPQELPNGDKYMIMRLNAHFYQPFDLRNYPLDTQRLTVDIEDSGGTLESLVYVPDMERSGLDAGLTVPGWTIAGLKAEELVHDYGTDFGDANLVDGNVFSAVFYSIEMRRNQNYFVWKLLFPLIIVLITCWVALLLNPRWVELRTGIPFTALLAVVFLQMSYADALPEVAELVLMDKIYVLTYVLVIATLIQVVARTRTLREDSSDAVVSKIWRIDIVSVSIQVLVFTGALAALVLAR